MAAKKWAIRMPYIPGSERKAQPSKAATYREVEKLRQLWASGALRDSHVAVYVDEGYGWQNYEHLDFRDEPAR